MNCAARAALVLVVPATVLVLRVFVRNLGPMFRGASRSSAVLNTVLQENVAGIRVVKAFAREEHEIERYERRQRRPARAGLAVRRMVANAFPLHRSSARSASARHVGRRALIVHGTLTVGGWWRSPPT